MMRMRFIIFPLLILLLLLPFTPSSVHCANPYNPDLTILLPLQTYSRFITIANVFNLTLINLPGLFTLFAPSNSAFKKFQGCLLGSNMNKTATLALLKYHFIRTPRDYSTILDTASSLNPWKPRTLYKEEQLNIIARNKVAIINKSAIVVDPNVANYQSVAAHGIDTVLNPPDVIEATVKMRVIPGLAGCNPIHQDRTLYAVFVPNNQQFYPLSISFSNLFSSANLR